MNHSAGGSRGGKGKEERAVDPREEGQKERGLSGMQPASAQRLQWDRAQGHKPGRVQARQGAGVICVYLFPSTLMGVHMPDSVLATTTCIGSVNPHKTLKGAYY